MTVFSLIFFVPILLIGIGYYYDYKKNPKQFKADIRGGTLYLLGFLVLILIERIVFDVGYIYLALQAAILILLSFCAKYLFQKENNKA